MVIQTKNIDDDVVISGIAGRFPECDTVTEFQDKLLSGIDLVKENDSRWPKGISKSKFDFGVTIIIFFTRYIRS